MIESKIVSILDANTITNYPHPAPHDATFPCVTYQFIAPMHMRAHTGYVVNRERWQLNIWAYDRAQMLALRATVKGLFDLNQTDFELGIADGEQDLPDAESNLYRRALDVLLWE